MLPMALWRENIIKKIWNVANGYSTVLEHSPCHPKVEGLSTDATADTVREKMAKIRTQILFNFEI
jgi:hypothetical protein